MLTQNFLLPLPSGDRSNQVRGNPSLICLPANAMQKVCGTPIPPPPPPPPPSLATQAIAASNFPPQNCNDIKGLRPFSSARAPFFSPPPVLAVDQRIPLFFFLFFSTIATQGVFQQFAFFVFCCQRSDGKAKFPLKSARNCSNEWPFSFFLHTAVELRPSTPPSTLWAKRTGEGDRPFFFSPSKADIQQAACPFPPPPWWHGHRRAGEPGISSPSFKPREKPHEVFFLPFLLFGAEVDGRCCCPIWSGFFLFGRPR